MQKTDPPSPEIYTPSSVLGIFSNALRLPATVQLVHVRGRYAYGSGRAYGGYYYDTLYSEGDSVPLGIKIPGLLRGGLTEGGTCTLRGFIEKSVKNSSIQLVLSVDGVERVEERGIPEHELKKYELIQAKLASGSRDLQTLVRTAMLEGRKVRVANIYGNQAIVQDDFRGGLGASERYFEVEDHACSITSATSIRAKLAELRDGGYDIIGIVRGGGDRQSFEAFEDAELAEDFIKMPALTVTALGHTVDECLLDRLADRSFRLPHDYGAGLHAVAERTAEERSGSRALLIEEVRKDVRGQFEEQVKTLSEQLAARNRELEKSRGESERQAAQITAAAERQLKAQSAEAERHRAEMAESHRASLLAAVRAEAAPILARAEMADRENSRLKAELEKKKTGYLLMLAILIAGIVIGMILSRL